MFLQAYTRFLINKAPTVVGKTSCSVKTWISVVLCRCSSPCTVMRRRYVQRLEQKILKLS